MPQTRFQIAQYIPFQRNAQIGFTVWYLLAVPLVCNFGCLTYFILKYLYIGSGFAFDIIINSDN